MPFATVTYTKKDHIAHITLNRPEVNNIINQQLAQELEDVCHGINQDNDIYVVIITGAGDKAFCGGSELELEAKLSGFFNGQSELRHPCRQGS